MKNLELLTESEIFIYLQGNDSLADKLSIIPNILKTHNTKPIIIIIDNFIENIPVIYENEMKTYNYKKKNDKKILKIEIYRTDASLQWERNKYIHHVISYSDDLKKHPRYEKRFPFSITTEGGNCDLTYYPQGLDEYIPASPNFTPIESVIMQKADKDLRSLGLYDSFEIALPVV